MNTQHNDVHELGQLIPLHYHYQMLSDEERMSRFRSAIDYIVAPGSTVLEFGCGTGALSYFAAQRARKVYAVEINPELANEARRLLARNTNGDRVEVVLGDAFEYTPPEPVDVVICEMLHVGLLREKQLPVLDAFKRRYSKRFGDKLPRFIPEAVLQGVVPVSQDFNFEGYMADIPQFLYPYAAQPRTVELGAPVVYHQALYEQPFELTLKWSGELQIRAEGKLNALRVITKNLLAIREDSTIDWHSQYLILPIGREIMVKPGDAVKVSFEYAAGAPLNALRPEVSEI
jgi:predicted RNA methylase